MKSMHRSILSLPKRKNALSSCLWARGEASSLSRDFFSAWHNSITFRPYKGRCPLQQFHQVSTFLLWVIWKHLCLISHLLSAPGPSIIPHLSPGQLPFIFMGLLASISPILMAPFISCNHLFIYSSIIDWSPAMYISVTIVMAPRYLLDQIQMP